MITKKVLVCISIIVLGNTVNAQNADISDELIPLLTIETINGEMPTCDIILEPGATITNNNYVPGKMTMTLNGETLYSSGEYITDKSGIRIKRRGNSTAVFLNQHPYKIKLSKKFDLLRRTGDADYRHKEWLLMSMYTWNPVMTNDECNILNMAGLLASKLLNKEWTPEYDFVQVVLNGEYQGMYYLMEPVTKGNSRIPLSNDGTGFIIEHDFFWWNEDKYFKTDRMTDTFGYTYKEPDSDDVTEEINADMANYMNEVENAIYNHKDISNYIDITSFAKWALLHDILATQDSWGSNRFLTRYDNTSLIQMGPAWDYDTTFRCEGWSNIHSFEEFYIHELLKLPEFIAEYTKLWKTVRPTFIQEFNAGMDALWEKYGNVFDQNMAIHKTKYPNEGMNTFDEQINEVKEKMTERISVLDELIKEYDHSTIIIDIKNNKNMINYINIQGCKVKPNKGKGLYIIQDKDGTYHKILN